jgi:type VI secretion system protein ImpK
MRRGGELNFSQGDVQDIGFALIALIDEVILSRAGELRDFWLPRMLQLQYSNTNVAGEEFFNRLQVVRQDPSRSEVLKVYYLCLLFGFQGKYRIRGGEVELGNIVEEVGYDLQRFGQMRTPPLSPHAERPKESIGGARRHMPLIWMSIGAVVLSIVLYVGLRISLHSQASDLIERIGQLAGGGGGS